MNCPQKSWKRAWLLLIKQKNMSNFIIYVVFLSRERTALANVAFRRVATEFKLGQDVNKHCIVVAERNVPQKTYRNRWLSEACPSLNYKFGLHCVKNSELAWQITILLLDSKQSIFGDHWHSAIQVLKFVFFFIQNFFFLILCSQLLDAEHAPLDQGARDAEPHLPDSTPCSMAQPNLCVLWLDNDIIICNLGSEMLGLDVHRSCHIFQEGLDWTGVKAQTASESDQ